MVAELFRFKEKKMALEKTVTLVDNFGQDVVLQNAYVKVKLTSSDKKTTNCYVDIRKVKDGDVFETKLYGFFHDLNGKNFIAQAYEHLKTLPEFSGATDC
jgi:hypothetical protein